jgi:hypothetical protein
MSTRVLLVEPDHDAVREQLRSVAGGLGHVGDAEFPHAREHLLSNS